MEAVTPQRDAGAQTPEKVSGQMPREVKFTKAIGGWLFNWGHATFFAYHNEAGFAHRDWELQLQVDRTDRDGEPRRRFDIIEDMLASRKECVDAAVDWYNRIGHTLYR